jgi:hypothetical protein
MVMSMTVVMVVGVTVSMLVTNRCLPELAHSQFICTCP